MLNEVIQTYPQPIAQAYGRIIRAQSDVVRLDQILRCVEVTTRYVAALSIASFAARKDLSVQPPEAFSKFRGNLSFGSFLYLIKEMAEMEAEHPLITPLVESFPKKKSVARKHLFDFLDLRNEMGHDLSGLHEPRAIQLLNTHTPLEKLEETLLALTPLCNLPLFLVDAQKPVKKINHIVRLLLMGESDNPVPAEAPVSEPFMESKRLYVGCEQGVLPLYPMILWDMERDRAAQGIYLIHQIKEKQLVYRSLSATEQPTNPPEPAEMLRLLDGGAAPIEAITLYDGRSFLQEWQEQRSHMASGTVVTTQTINWLQMDQDILRWYAKTLKPQVKPDSQSNAIDWNNPVEAIRQVLLDGRGEVTPEEQRQLLLLFGTGQEIRRAIGRDILDLRARLDDSNRWSARRELAENLLVALRQAVEFISQNNPLISELSSVNNLQTTVGSADYIAVRESLINLIIHQDYADPRTVAQIELEPHRTTMVNAGSSLISEDELANGGTSTARNPLIARALKLIGFAELGGSGLREVSRVWRNAKRRPPVVRSDEQNNRFRIELDSRPLKIIADSFWKQRLGATVSPEEAKILALLGSVPEGMRITDICAGSGSLLSEAQVMCQRLERQQLIDCDADIYRLKTRLQDLAQEIT